MTTAITTTAYYTTTPELDDNWKNDEYMSNLTINPNGIDDDNDPEFVPYNQREWNWGSVDMSMLLCDLEREERDNVKYFVKDVLAEVNPDGKFDSIAYKCDNFGWMNRTVGNAMDIEDFVEDPVSAIAPNTSEFSQEWNFEGGVLIVTQYHHDSPTGETWEFQLFAASDDDM